MVKGSGRGNCSCQGEQGAESEGRAGEGGGRFRVTLPRPTSNQVHFLRADQLECPVSQRLSKVQTRETSGDLVDLNHNNHTFIESRDYDVSLFGGLVLCLHREGQLELHSTPVCLLSLDLRLQVPVLLLSSSATHRAVRREVV